MNDELLTVDEVAHILKLHPYTIRKLLRGGLLLGVRVGGQWRIRRSALDGYIREVK